MSRPNKHLPKVEEVRHYVEGVAKCLVDKLYGPDGPPEGTRLADHQGRVQGTYPMLFQPSLVACLGKRVRVQGQVERRGRRIVSVQVLAVESLENES